MNLSRPALLRIAPFAAFMVALAVRGAAPADGAWGIDARWLYGLQVLASGGLLLWWWREYGELARQNLPGVGEAALAAGVGLVVFVLWIQLTAPWMQIGQAAASFVPVDAQGQRQWLLITVRWIGAALVVPLMEELFWRSFVMRWIEHPVFEGVDPRRVGLRAIVLSTFAFTLVHTLWLGAIVAGLAYAWLYRRSGTLWAPVIAHAVTNGALGVWVVQTGRWEFW